MQKTSTLALNGPRKINHAIDAVLTSFASSFDYIFPGKPASIIRGPELSKVWNEYKEKMPDAQKQFGMNAQELSSPSCIREFLELLQSPAFRFRWKP